MSLQPSKPAVSRNLATALTLTWIIIPLAALASGGGVWISDLYRDPAAVIPAMRGQDIVTLVALAVLVFALPSVRRGSAPFLMTWIGVLGYLFYTYAGAAFAYYFNEFFLIYVALFSLSGFALVAAATGIDARKLKERFDGAEPRRVVSVFMALVAFMLVVLWLGQIIPFLTQGTIPELIVRAQTPTNFVYVLDLGVIVPLALLGAVWLWRRSPWGYILAGVVTIKFATMGFALLSMTWFSAEAGIVISTEETAVNAVIAFGGLGMAIWFFRHCRRG